MIIRNIILSMFVFMSTTSIMFISCIENDGGKCTYNKVDAYIIIDSILSLDDYCRNKCKYYSEKDCKMLYNNECYNLRDERYYYLYFSIFRKTDNKKIESMNDLVDTSCIFANLFSVGDTIFSGNIDVLNRGACQNIIFKFDYSKCFIYYGD